LIKNFFKIAVRNLLRNKVYAFINVIGLSVGLTGCLVVATMVMNELSYDRSWKKSDRIYRANFNDSGTHETVPVVLSGMAPSLKQHFPEVENYCRLEKRRKSFSINDNKVTIDCITTEASFLEVFNVDFLRTSSLTGKSGYRSVILTKEIADKYFAGLNPIGQPIKNILGTGSFDSVNYIVTGVIKEIPYNSHLRAAAIVLREFGTDDNVLTEWGNGMLYASYLLLKPGTNISQFQKKVDRWYASIVNEAVFKSTTFQPLQQIYLHSDFAEGYQQVIGDMQQVYIFSGVAIVLLLIACFNFINLTTARALKRVAETSVRKVLGANKPQLIAQFLFESLVFFVLSFLISMALYPLLMQLMESYLGHTLDTGLLQNIQLLTTVFFILLLISLFTGIYPALFAASIKPATALKGKLTAAPGSNGWLRKTLVAVQFSMAIIIFIAVIVVRKQLFFLNNADIGYDKNNLLQINYTFWGEAGSVFKQDVKRIAGVENASLTRWSPGSGGGSMTMQVADSVSNTKTTVWFIDGDLDFIPTLKLQLKKGRLLSNQFSADIIDPTIFFKTNEPEKVAEAQAKQSILFTDYAAVKLELKDLNQSSAKVPGVPVGVISNFHNESMKKLMQPCVIKANEHITYGSMLIRVKPGAAAQVISSLNKLWVKFYPLQTLNYQWVDEALAKQYEAERKAEQLFLFFSILSVFVACLGLFGLANFSTEVRTKEIGIRKVLGASTAMITTLISKEFLTPVFIAIIIASPIAYMLMNHWLQDYVYRINISWWMFAVAGLVAVLIALTTVGFQAIKAAMANPVKSLRTE